MPDELREALLRLLFVIQVKLDLWALRVKEGTDQ